MQTVHLDKDYSWQGKVYLAGPCAIPDELAIALGFQPEPAPTPDAEQPQPTGEDEFSQPAPTPVGDDEPQPSPEERLTVRVTELRAMYDNPDQGYRAIKELSQRYELGDRAPDGGWDQAIELIAQFEVDNGLI